MDFILMRRFAFLPALFLVSGCGDVGEPASVRFAEPQDGARVTGPDVQVVLEASGVEITSADIHEEGTGHHHIFVDEDVTPLSDTIPSGVSGIYHYGRGQTEMELRDLEPGEHRLIAVVANWAHIPLDPPVMDTVFFTVEAREDEEAGEGGAAGDGSSG